MAYSAKALAAGEAFENYSRKTSGIGGADIAPLKTVLMDLVDLMSTVDTKVTAVKSSVDTMSAAKVP